MNKFFENPWLLLGLFALVFLVIALQRIQGKLVASLALWLPPRFIQPISLCWFIRNNFCLIGGMLLLIIAAAGPLHSNHKTSALETRNGLVVIALKADGKTLQSSIGLQARLLSQIQKEFFQLDGGRIALMPYGGESDIFCPLTLDPDFYDYVASSLKRVTGENAKADTLDMGFSLSGAIKNAIETLANQTLNIKQMVVVLFEKPGEEESIRDALIRANIPADIGMTLVFPEASKVPEILGVYCAGKNANAVALDSKIIPEDRVFDVLKKGQSNRDSFSGVGEVYIASPAWFAFPGLLCLLLAIMFPPNVCGLVLQFVQRVDK